MRSVILGKLGFRPHVSCEEVEVEEEDEEV